MSSLGIAMSGIAAATDRFERAASTIARANTGLPGDDGDLVSPLVDEVEASQSLKANVTVARTADQMLGTLIDVIA